MRRITAKRSASFLILVLTLSISSFLRAQDGATLTGIVTDQSGAVLPGAEVVLVDSKTNSTYRAATSSSGAYTITGVRPGEGYKVSFSAENFKTLEIPNFPLEVGSIRTQNAKLSVGNTQTVEVSSSSQEVTLNTTDASIGNNLSVELLNKLPIQDRSSPAVLFTLQPGVANDSVTGARTDQSTVTVDGLDVNDIATGQFSAIVSEAPVDSVEEFKGTVAGQITSNGPGGGGQYQLITKSGTNKFHGDLNEYHRDNSTVANNWFNNNAGVPIAPYIRNQFGGQIGGPIKQDKIFFFFNFYDSRIIQSANVNATVPLDSFRAGNVSYIKDTDGAGNTCNGASRQNTTPQCIGTLDSAGVAALDPLGIGFNTASLAFITNRYPHANDLTSGDGINTGGFRFTAPTPDFQTNYVGKVDYNINQSMKFFARTSINRRNATEGTFRFPGDPQTNPFVDRSYSYVVGHVWSLGSNKVNQFIFGDTISKFDFPSLDYPLGTTILSYGLIGSPYNSPSSQKRRVPVPEVRDDFNWQKGSHDIAFGGTFKFVKTNSRLVNDFNFVGVGLGGNVSQLNPSLRPADIRTAGTTASSTYDNAFALALGRISSIGSNYNYNNQGAVLPQGNGETRRYRFFETELYASDSWKVTKALTISYGLRYQLYSVPYETGGNESIQNTSFDDYFKARIAQSAAGASGDSSVPFISYNLGGKANHAGPLYKPSYKDFAPRFAFAYSPNSLKNTVINGGIGIVYDRTVINAVNFIQDQSSYLFQNSANTNYGSDDANASLATDPRLGANNAIPAPPVAPAVGHPYTPFVDSNGTPFGLANNEFNTAIDPNLKDPYNIAFNAGIQQQLPGRLVLKMNYVGRLGRRLLGQADASQLIDFPDLQSGELMSTAFASITKQIRAGADPTNLAPEPWFENVVLPGVGQANGAVNNTSLLASAFNTFVYNGDFADFTQALAANGIIQSNVGMASQLAENTFITNKGFSTYHGMLVTLSKNYSNGLKFDVNYTWAHSIDNVSVVANYIAAGVGSGFICDALRPRNCRGTSDFDTASVINSNFVYDLPVGRGKMFAGNASRLVDEVIGGWSFSGIPAWRSGVAYNAFSDAYVAGYANNAPAIFTGSRGLLAVHNHKNSDGSVNIYDNPTGAQAAFTGPIGFTIGKRNILRTPPAFTMDAGLAKTFPIVGDRVNVIFRADAFNVFNHPNFTAGVSDITAGNFGQISSTANSPRVAQLALRVEF